MTLEPGNRDLDKLSKASSGSCEWFETEVYVRKRDAFAEEHEPAIVHLEGLMELAELTGLPPGNYDAPVGRNRLIARRPKPWVGELKSDGPEDEHGHVRQYRLYFGEAPVDQASLLAAFIDWKHTGWPVRKQKSKQTTHITKAMDQITNWCRTRRQDYRKLWDSGS